MSDPRRLLLDPDATPLERSLLASWGREQPSAGARANTLAIAGLAAGAALTGTGSAAAAGGSIAPKAAGAGGIALLKWLAVGALAVGGAGAALGVVHPRVHAHEASPVPSARAPAPIAPPTPAPPMPDAPPVAPPAPVDVSPPEAASVITRKPTSRPSEPRAGLGEQIAALDRARAALSAGDAPRALRLVDEYEARFPGGAFAQEADVLRVEALLRQGDRTGAARVGTRFLAAHPTSPHAARVRALLDRE